MRCSFALTNALLAAGAARPLLAMGDGRVGAAAGWAATPASRLRWSRHRRWPPPAPEPPRQHPGALGEELERLRAELAAAKTRVAATAAKTRVAATAAEIPLLKSQIESTNGAVTTRQDEAARKMAAAEDLRLRVDGARADLRRLRVEVAASRGAKDALEQRVLGFGRSGMRVSETVAIRAGRCSRIPSPARPARQEPPTPVAAAALPSPCRISLLSARIFLFYGSGTSHWATMAVLSLSHGPRRVRGGGLRPLPRLHRYAGARQCAVGLATARGDLGGEGDGIAE